VLRVPEVIVCGHTDCGVMKGALNPQALAAYPNVYAWLRYAQVERRESQPTAEVLLALTEENVIAQLKKPADPSLGCGSIGSRRSCVAWLGLSHRIRHGDCLP